MNTEKDPKNSVAQKQVQRRLSSASEEEGDAEKNNFALPEEKTAHVKERKSGIGFVLEGYLRAFYATQDLNFLTPRLYEKIIREVERPLWMVTLEITKGNRIKAAQMLGINRNTFLKKMRLLGLDDKCRNFSEDGKGTMVGKKRKRLSVK